MEQTKQNMVELLPGIFAVEVPDEISDPHLYRVNENAIMLKWNDVKRPLNPYDLIRVDRYYGDLKDYKWPEILFTTKDCTEEQAAEIVDSHWDTELGAMRYGLLKDNSMVHFLPTESLRSLLRSKGLSPENNYLLIRKLK